MINNNFGPIGLQKCMNSNKNINKNEIENENLRFSVRDIINQHTHGYTQTTVRLRLDQGHNCLLWLIRGAGGSCPEV